MTTTRLLTVEDMYDLPDDGHRYDLIRGELHRMAPTGDVHGDIAGEFYVALHQYARQSGVGKAVMAEVGHIIARHPESVLSPDAAFIRYDRLPSDRDPVKFLPVAPDLVVEVRSPSERAGEIRVKIEAYLEAGVAIVLDIDPRRRVVHVHRPGVAMRTLSEADTFDGGEVLPGFSVKVADMFRGW